MKSHALLLEKLVSSVELHFGELGGGRGAMKGGDANSSRLASLAIRLVQRHTIRLFHRSRDALHSTSGLQNPPYPLVLRLAG